MSLAEVLAWKFDHASGIRTREKRDEKGKPTGVMEIFNWPESLGPKPTPEQVSQWIGEFNALPPDPPRFEAEAEVIENAAEWSGARSALAALLRKL